MPESKVRELADGRIYTGLQAKENGLVDSLGLRLDAFDQMAKLIDAKGVKGSSLNVIRFSRSYGFLETLSFEAQSGIDTLDAVRTVSGVLRGDRDALASTQRSSGYGHGVARLEYRTSLG